MRILVLSTSMGMGGADQQILLLAQAMRRRGHDVRIIALAPLGVMGREARQAGIATDSLELGRNLGAFPKLLRLWRWIRAWRPDVVHSHMAHANLLARVLRPVAGVPALISTIHSINDGGRLHVLAYRLTDRFADRYTIISRLAAAHYVTIKAVQPGRLHVVPNTVDIERFRRRDADRAAVRQALGVRNDEFVWLAVGRFERAKDYPTMIAAFSLLAARRPDATLWLVGEGSLQADVEAMVRAEGLASRVHFLGVRRDVPELMSAADGYVLSSAWEGMPVVLLEAAAVELPVVATQVGGVSEVVEDGVTGLLVPSGDSAALAGAMERIEALTPDARARLGAAGRALVERQYGPDRLMDTWERLYTEVAAAGGAGR